MHPAEQTDGNDCLKPLFLCYDCLCVNSLTKPHLSKKMSTFESLSHVPLYPRNLGKKRTSCTSHLRELSSPNDASNKEA